MIDRTQRSDGVDPAHGTSRMRRRSFSSGANPARKIELPVFPPEWDCYAVARDASKESEPEALARDSRVRARNPR